MTAKEVKLDKVRNLSDFYDLLDEKALQLERKHEITELLLIYKNITSSDDEIQKLQWEVEASLFSFHGSRVFSFSTSNGKNVGEVSEYPQLDNTQGAAFEYLRIRAVESKSYLLRARYNHLLWKGIVKKNNSYASAATANYIQAIIDCCKSIKDHIDDCSYLIGTLYENLVATASEGNAKIFETKELTDFLLHEAEGISFYTKHGIVEDMLKHPKIFKSKDFDKVLSIFAAHIKSAGGNPDDFLLTNYHIPTAIKVAKKQNSDVKSWYDEIGYAYLRIAERETEADRHWLKLNDYARAIEAFRLSGNLEKKRECEQLYFDLKPHVRLDEYRIDFDEETMQKLREIQDELKEKAKILLKEEPNYIYAFIANGSFFPKYSVAVRASKEKKDEFLDFATTVHFDGNKNISAPNPETKERREILNAYGMRIQETLLPFLHYVIVLGIKSGHLTYKNFLEFLFQHTWIGKPHVKTDLSGNAENTNWINQVAPAVIEFFVQVQAWGESSYYTPNFILCIDSLTLKIEGLFRNFSERLNYTTSIGKKKGMQESLVHDVINNETIRSYFNEEDMLLFDYVFSNDGGLNLRNNIAHCFYSENEYNPDKMLLLLAVLLRLGKYNIKAEE